MYVIAIHQISDPEAFWSRASEGDIPDGLELPTVAPNSDGTRAVCVWKSDSVEAVKSFVEGTAGDVSSNEFFEVNDGNAQGLPA
ncbi:MAG TPA: hypothetical protein VKA88_00230 [Solirubrobacterales bacterium]|nr:hypothetical protein [Solirubrobacterales bacterium]